MKRERKIVGTPKKTLLELTLLLSLTVILPSVTPVSASSTIWTTVYLSPSSVDAPPPNVGETFTLDINVDNVTDLYAWSIGLTWNSSVLNCKSFTYDYSFFGPSGDVLTIAGAINNTRGQIDPPYAATLTTVAGVTGSGTLAEAEFLVKNTGISWINLTIEAIVNSTEDPIPYNAVNSSFTLIAHGPTAVKTHTPLIPDVYGTVIFNASDSEPGFNGAAEVPIASYTWDFGDGNTTTVSNPVINHIYRAVGTHLVNLTVTCQYDAVLAAKGLLSDTVTQNVTVIMPPYPVTIRVPRDYPTIQAAINAARDNDTILVASGTYYENVVVDKSVTLVGEGSSDTIIDGDKNWHVVTITADNVELSGFTVQNGLVEPGWGYQGILLQNVQGCVIRYNSVVNNLVGIKLTYSNGNTIEDNLIMDNEYGIRLDYSNDNTIVANTVKSNTVYGVFLRDSNGNDVYHNNFIDNLPQAYDNTANAWDDGSKGNYWSDYAGQDLNNNGIGDTPYIIDSNSRDRYPLMKIWGHDLAIINITVSRKIAFLGYPVYIQVTLENQGNYTTETTNVTLYYGNTVIEKRTVTLTAGTRRTYQFTWIPTSTPKADYTINATLQALIGETDTADNTYVGGSIRVTIPGDADGDWFVGIKDLTILAKAWYATVGKPNYNPQADFDLNGRIDIHDLALLAKHWYKDP